MTAEEAGGVPGNGELDIELARRLNILAGTEQLLIALDFDGTMAPLVPRAQDARALPENAAALEKLACLPRTVTALVSGRALDSLKEVASPPASTLLVGSHGAEFDLRSRTARGAAPGTAPTGTAPEEQATIPLSDDQRETLRQAVAILEKLTTNFPGTTLEGKPAGVVLHVREAEAEVGQSALLAAREALSHVPGAYLGDGKMVLEVAVVKASKGQAIAVLREQFGATAVLFAGDDVTDETVFEVLGPQDVGIKVGQGPSAASYRIAGPQELAEVLEFVARTRS